MLPRFVSLLVVLALPVCSNEISREALVVLEVAGKPVTLAELDSFVSSSTQGDSPVLSSEIMGALFDEFVEEQLLLMRAEEAGIEADPRAVAERMEALAAGERASPDVSEGSIRASDAVVAKNLERQLRIETLVETEVLARVTVEDDEIVTHFQTNPLDYIRPETVDVSQILVDGQEEANEIRQLLRGRNVSFEDLAQERSQGPEASRGGHLGTFARGELPPSFEAEVFALRPGAISEVVSTDFGFHLFRVNRRSPEASLGIEDVRESIRVELLRKKSDAAMERYLAELAERYPVRIHQEHLDFAVVGKAERMESMRLERNP